MANESQKDKATHLLARWAAQENEKSWLFRTLFSNETQVLRAYTHFVVLYDQYEDMQRHAPSITEDEIEEKRLQAHGAFVGFAMTINYPLDLIK